ncbi:hypothetical protein E3J84_07195 [Candidatus Aerophobetes bacterium]|uniref:F5/8 type C domain-containing protein n=1 Tax=Aerophobetes bacterium TaxID=2030807 RepID=A0A523RPG6_UNCAE|nr:MAG: hypothetical protein E3J84_07195 [Candidatus Aerophobetes bacterium]
MKRTKLLGLVFTLAFAVATLALVTSAASGEKLTLTSEMVVNESPVGDPTLLVDEQELAGDPPTGHCTTLWQAGASPNNYPIYAYIDLGQTYNIISIWLHDIDGQGDFKVSYGTPGNWTELFIYTTSVWNVWVENAVSINTQYLRFIMTEPKAKIAEVCVYGTAGEPPTPTPTPTPTSTGPTPTPTPTPTPGGITIDKAMGTNCFIDDPHDKIAVAGIIREYHNWNWDEGDEPWFSEGTYPGYPNNENRWQPSYGAYGYSWYFDDYYDDLSTNYNIIISPCIQGSVYWITGENWDNKPLYAGEDSTDPASYIEHADHMYQYAARYASVEVNDSYLKLASDQPRETGLNLIKYYENWNEPDNWWAGDDAHFSPQELAAMCSADYDGHEGTMGSTVGVKNADPNAKLVLGGIADGTNLQYLQDMKAWFDSNRSDDEFAVDVINMHIYCTDYTSAFTPEEFDLKGKTQTIVDWVRTNLPNKEVWYTEFGYDTCQARYRGKYSWVRAVPHAGYDAQEVQAQWIIRCYLVLFAAGVDRATQYMLRDVDPNSGLQYSSCGLVGPKDDWTPKKSWYYVYTMRNRLTGMYYVGEQSSGNSDVWIYKFKTDGGDDGAYVLWCPTRDGTTVDDYELTLTGSPTSATLVEMANEDTDGVETSLTISEGKVTVDVSERPIFVLVNDI